MSKMSELSRQTEEVEIAYINSQCEQEPDYQSSCCTAEPFGNSFIEEELTGICSKCYDGANFNDLNKDE
jgi:hypothetical protein